MDLPHNVESRLTITGFTMNPITDSYILKAVLTGLTSYKEEHLCDYGHQVIHKNYLGQRISDPMITNCMQYGFIQGHVVLTNGWINIRITSDVYPAKVVADVYLNNSMPDADIIIDHLCAPALPLDGMGLFDYTYTLHSTPIPNTAMSKHNKMESPYKVNEPANVSEDKVEVTLNKLSTIECHFCSSPATTWLIIGPPMSPDATSLTPPRVVTSCKNHIGNGRVTEIRYNIDEIPENDFVVAGNNSTQYEMLDVLDENGNFQYTINKIKET